MYTGHNASPLNGGMTRGLTGATLRDVNTAELSHPPFPSPPFFLLNLNETKRSSPRDTLTHPLRQTRVKDGRALAGNPCVINATLSLSDKAPIVVTSDRVLTWCRKRCCTRSRRRRASGRAARHPASRPTTAPRTPSDGRSGRTSSRRGPGTWRTGTASPPCGS